MMLYATRAAPPLGVHSTAKKKFGLQAGNWSLGADSYSQREKVEGEQARNKKRDLTRGLFRVRLVQSCCAFSFSRLLSIIFRRWARQQMKKHTRTQVQWKIIT
jgi:hypothetical protein